MTKKILFFIVIGISQILYAMGLTPFLTDLSEFYKYCVADYLIFFDESRNVGLILGTAMIFLSLNEMKNDFSAMNILLYSSKKTIVLKQVKKVLVNSAIISIVSLVFTIFSSAFFSESFYNWDKKNSLYEMQFKSTNDSGFFLVVLLTFLSMFITLSLIGIFSMIFAWGNISSLFLMGSLVLVCVIEICTNARLFTNLLKIKYEMISNIFNFGWVCIEALAFGFISAFILKKMVVRREFL
ncbi:hypothetical protein SAMN05216249_12822 [Acetitomaculum ruminis DSM 5522]|uniref:Uncharacterized protein n=1 Tax=Acetitomaculum ruminis DSM 5522 TaxID=1120918 RepID=A0A1I1AIG1_9FIRM|nr:hypothetical protein [Acetitomaculum ruminis]SFB37821.1 hypothetical protein SAMN05216249_12822 [Acetitomaculum ruminis DSM 5522]